MMVHDHVGTCVGVRHQTGHKNASSSPRTASSRTTEANQASFTVEDRHPSPSQVGTEDEPPASAEEEEEMRAAASEWERERVADAQRAERSKKHKPFRPR